MIKKITISLLILCIAIFVAARLLISGMLDRKYNKTLIPPPYKVSQQTKTLYNSFDFIADLHSDVLLWQRDLLVHNDFGHQDLPRMIEANLALQAFTIVSKVPDHLNFNSNTDESDQLTLPYIIQGRPIRTWFDLTDRVIDQANALHHFSNNSSGQLTVIKSRQNLNNYLQRRSKNKKLTAGFLGIEGAHALAGNLSNIDRIYDAGIRMIGLTHFFDNEIGGSAHGVNKNGLTEFGKQAVKKMEEKSIIIDLAHASPALITDVLSIATRPVLVSHTGVKGTCDSIRNLSDRQLKDIAENGGIIGIAVFKAAVCGTEVSHIASAIFYTSQLIGAEHIAMGSDFDGSIETIVEVRGLPLIVEELLQLGMSNKHIQLIMGENIKRFLLQNLPE